MNFTARFVAAGLLLALPNVALTSALAAQDNSGEIAVQAEAEPIWAFEESDVELDPSYVFGQLDNGMRYILRENATPEGTALVRMRIDSGSLDETDSERGLSHYLEHMAFNGSKNIPEGEMVKLLEREGLAFGADTNASTGLEAITYKLNLPRNDEDLLDTALMLMRETASELSISEDAVERERGVILAERRDRRNYYQRAWEDEIEFIAPDARYGERSPIGTLDVLENATAAQLRALYQRTYTPENTVLVIIGDFDTALMEAKIRERFEDWGGPPAPADPVTGPVDLNRQGLTDIYIDPALSESVKITRLGEWIDEPDTVANREHRILRDIGYSIIARRMTRLANGADAPFLSASLGGGDLFEDARSTSLTISTVDGEWKTGMLAAVQVVNEALTHGFTKAEVEEQLARRRTGLDNRVKAADTRVNGYFEWWSLGLVARGNIPTTPQYRQDLFTRIEPTITPESVLAAVLETAVPLENPLIRFQGRAEPDGGKEALRAAFADAMSLPIAPPEETGTIEFAYTDFGTPGSIVSDEIDERLGIRKLGFSNGVRLNLKKTEVSKDRISVAVRVDGGNLLKTRDEPLKVYLGSSLTAGGLGKHTLDEIQSALAGRSVAYRFSSGADGFNSSGTTTPRDLELQMQLIAAILTDPGYRPDGVERYRKRIDNFFATLNSTPGRAYSSAAGARLSDDDPRFSLQAKDAYLALDYDQLRDAISDRLAKGAIEVALVGDLDEEAAIAAVASTLGALPMRERAFQPYDEARQRSFTARRGLTVLEHEGEADQAQVRMIWPTTDNEDLAESLRLSILSRVVRLELTDKLREELGQAYSPSAQSSTSRVFDDYGTFSIAASVDVGEVEATREALLDLLGTLRSKPISADTLDRARKPVLENYENALKGLGGWMSLAARAQSEPERIERWFAAPDILRSMTPEDLQTEALQYLDPKEAVEVRVLPGENAKRAEEDVPAAEADAASK